MKVLLTRKLHEFVMKELRQRYDVYVHNGAIPMPKDKLLSKISQMDGLVCFPYDIIDKEIIANAKKLRIISTYSVGYDHIDLQKAKSRTIKIGYTPDVLTNATADLALALLLDSMRRVTEGDRIIREGNWKIVFGPHDYVGSDLEGKTIGILGMGRIGRAVAKRIRPFGMKIAYHSRNRLPESEEKKLSAKYMPLEELFEKSDAITIHIPYTKDTHGIVNMQYGKWETIRELGKGGQGTVFLVRDTSAVKLEKEVFPLIREGITQMHARIMPPGQYDERANTFLQTISKYLRAYSEQNYAALKILHPDAKSDQQARARMQREVDCLSGHAGPHIF